MDHVLANKAVFKATTVAVGGTSTLTFTITPDGTVKRASAHGLGDVAPCVAQVVSAISFPRTDGVTRVRYPIVFRS